MKRDTGADYALRLLARAARDLQAAAVALSGALKSAPKEKPVVGGIGSFDEIDEKLTALRTPSVFATLPTGVQETILKIDDEFNEYETLTKRSWDTLHRTYHRANKEGKFD